jgi:hypothetical protein
MAEDSYEYEFLFRPLIGRRSRQGDGHRMHILRSSLLSKVRMTAKRSGATATGSARPHCHVGETPTSSHRSVVRGAASTRARERREEDDR